MKLKEAELLELWREEGLYDLNDELTHELVETGEWVDGGKYSSLEVIFKDVATGKHYSFEVTRSGSYFSHYEYEVFDGATEVTKVTETITVTRWV
ncbi:hypothetical protein NX029_26155 [Cytobacillus firmus]|nr:hypothetical protein [Cytobacillus firmus]